jgi:hypothetical protein
MNWKLILQLSLFGLAMGVATVFVVPSTIEPIFWLFIWVVCAYLIAKGTRDLRYLHGLLVGLANSVWIIAAHVLLYDAYAARHAKEVAMTQSISGAVPQRVLVALLGIPAGFVSGILIGLFALVAGKLIARPAITDSKAVSG